MYLHMALTFLFCLIGGTFQELNFENTKKGNFTEAKLGFVNGDKVLYHHSQFQDTGFLLRNGLTSVNKNDVVSGAKSGSKVLDALALAILNQSKGVSVDSFLPSGGLGSSQKAVKKTPIVDVDDEPIANKLRELVATGDDNLRRQKCAMEFSNSLTKRSRIFSLYDASLGCSITVGENKGWFGNKEVLLQVLQGFDLINDVE